MFPGIITSGCEATSGLTLIGRPPCELLGEKRCEVLTITLVGEGEGGDATVFIGEASDFFNSSSDTFV